MAEADGTGNLTAGVIAALRDAKSVFVLTGSGISAESGLPTFRGVGGLWRTHRVEELASPEGFARDPVLVWTWYNERKAAHERAQPNAGHFAIAQLEDALDDFTLATQNVDSLHLRAGSRNVLELHGSLREARCINCNAGRPLGAAGLPLDESTTRAAGAGVPISSGLVNRYLKMFGKGHEKPRHAPTSSWSSVRAPSSIPPLRSRPTIIARPSLPKSIRSQLR